ncbi:MAG TPA: serine hydrolase, partial [Candidatus Tumulicola sp.]
VSIVLTPLLPAGPGSTVDSERAVYPASMIKVPLAATCLLEAAAGRFSTTGRVQISTANMTANDAESPLVPGYIASVDQLIRLAIERSDNVATNQLLDLVGRERATELAAERLGLANTQFSRKLSGSEPLIDDPGWDGVHRNAHPAADAAALFVRIDAGDFEGASVLRECLLRQHWNDKLSAGLEAGDTFAHKTGDTDEVTHDAGILSTREGRRYVLVVYAAMPSSPENNARFGPFMHAMRALL